jgi:hypothetical protein
LFVAIYDCIKFVRYKVQLFDTDNVLNYKNRFYYSF